VHQACHIPPSTLETADRLEELLENPHVQLCLDLRHCSAGVRNRGGVNLELVIREWHDQLRLLCVQQNTQGRLSQPLHKSSVNEVHRSTHVLHTAAHK
jgi:hypothetical protein